MTAPRFLPPIKLPIPGTLAAQRHIPTGRPGKIVPFYTHGDGFIRDTATPNISLTDVKQNRSSLLFDIALAQHGANFPHEKALQQRDNQQDEFSKEITFWSELVFHPEHQTLVGNFFFISETLSSNIKQKLFDILVDENKPRSQKINWDLLNYFVEILCSGALTQNTLSNFIRHAKNGLTLEQLQEERRCFYSCRNLTGRPVFSDKALRRAIDQFLASPSLSFKSKEKILTALESRIAKNERATSPETLSEILTLLSNPNYSAINNHDINFFCSRLSSEHYTPADLKNDILAFSVFTDPHRGFPKGITRELIEFERRTFEIQSNKRGSNPYFRVRFCLLSARQQRALLLLEHAFGNIRDLTLTKKLFGNNSFNHPILNNEEKFGLADELLQTLADYLQIKQFSDLEAFRSDILIRSLFDPKFIAQEEFRGMTFIQNSLVRANYNKQRHAITQIGPLKEFRGLVWGFKHHPDFAAYPQAEDFPEWADVLEGHHKVSPDGIYPTTYQGEDALVLFETKSYSPGEDCSSLTFKDIPEFNHAMKQGPTTNQFRRCIRHMMHHDDLLLHYHLNTDVETFTRTGKRISDQERVTSFKRILRDHLRAHLHMEKHQLQNILDRIIVTFEPHHRAESLFDDKRTLSLRIAG